MKHRIIYYFTHGKNKELYAMVESFPLLIAHYTNGKWDFVDKEIHELKEEIGLEEVAEETALLYTFGVRPHYLYEELGCNFSDEPLDTRDSFSIFFDDFIEFARDDYDKLLHNKKKDLTYLASELDMHYGTDYKETIDEYYEEFRLRSNEYRAITIKKLENDYLIVFDKSIFD